MVLIKTVSIQSVGSTKTGKKEAYCWTFHKHYPKFAQKVKIVKCDAKDKHQHFKFVEGRLHPVAKPQLCVGYDVSRLEKKGSVAVTLLQCFGVNWGMS